MPGQRRLTLARPESVKFMNWPSINVPEDGRGIGSCPCLTAQRQRNCDAVAYSSSLCTIVASADVVPCIKRVATERYRYVAGRPWSPRAPSLPPSQCLSRTNPPQPTNKLPHLFAVNWTAVMTLALHTRSWPFTFIPKGHNLTNLYFKILMQDEEFDDWEPRFARQMLACFQKERV